MLELVAGIVIAIALWNLREAFYKHSSLFKEKTELMVKDQEVDLQNDFKELEDKIKEKKEANGGKWYSMQDIDNIMK